MTYTPSSNRYDSMSYRRTGRSGVSLPAVSLELWHNFDAESNARRSQLWAWPEK